MDLLFQIVKRDMKCKRNIFLHITMAADITRTTIEACSWHRVQEGPWSGQVNKLPKHRMDPA